MVAVDNPAVTGLLYQSEMWADGDIYVDFDVEDSEEYDLVLHFAENFAGVNGNGVVRKFGIVVNSEVPLGDDGEPLVAFDISAKVGLRTGLYLCCS